MCKKIAVLIMICLLSAVVQWGIAGSDSPTKAENSSKQPSKKSKEGSAKQPSKEGEEDSAEKTSEESKEEKQPAGPEAKAKEIYKKVVDAYMDADWTTMQKEAIKSGRYIRYLTPRQRRNLIYVRASAKAHRPGWWKHTKSSSNSSFKAEIWGRSFMANYMPSEAVGFAAPVDVHKGKVRVIVSWQPSVVDNPKPLDGKLAKKHGLSKGDIGEAIIWHELGHNYLTNFLPARHVIILYQKYSMLYMHLQEFYADLTALYHACPPARLAMLFMRIDAMEPRWYRESEPHVRASHAAGAYIIAEFLIHPDKWPNIHFPPEVPKQNVELNTILYVYKNIDPKWSLEEDRAFRDVIKTFIRTKGDKVFRNKGIIPLPSGLEFGLMATDDRDRLPKREKWITQRLKEIIKSGRADEKKQDDENKKRGTLIIMENESETIEVP